MLVEIRNRNNSDRIKTSLQQFFFIDAKKHIVIEDIGNGIWKVFFRNVF